MSDVHPFKITTIFIYFALFVKITFLRLTGMLKILVRIWEESRVHGHQSWNLD